jgi:hypothetical protein
VFGAEYGQLEHLGNPAETMAKATLERTGVGLAKQAESQTLPLMAKILNPLLWIS